MVRLTQRSTTAEVTTICAPISTSSLLIFSYFSNKKPKQHFKSFIFFIFFQIKNQTNPSNPSKIRTCPLTQWIFELSVPCDAMCAHFLPLEVYSFFQTKNQNHHHFKPENRSMSCTFQLICIASLLAFSTFILVFMQNCRDCRFSNSEMTPMLPFNTRYDNAPGPLWPSNFQSKMLLFKVDFASAWYTIMHFKQKTHGIKP